MIEEEAELVVGREAEGAVAIGVPEFAADGYFRFPIRLAAPGLSASTTMELEAWGEGISHLPAFLDDLSANWRGWSGSKDWHGRRKSRDVGYSRRHRSRRPQGVAERASVRLTWFVARQRRGTRRAWCLGRDCAYTPPAS